MIRLAERAIFRKGSTYGIPPDEVYSICRAHVKGMVEALNPESPVSIGMARCQCGRFSEMVIAGKVKIQKEGSRDFAPHS